MIAWTMAHPFLTFWLVLILGYASIMLTSHLISMMAVIFRGWKPQVCEECQMSLLDDPHNH